MHNSMKQRKLCNFGFIFLEAIVGIALFIIILVLLLNGMVHVTKQCIALQERHKALCAVLYSIEQMKKGKLITMPFDSAIKVTLQNLDHGDMPYMHSSVNVYQIIAQKGSQKVIAYVMGPSYEK
jgi:type II secretory pathway pseudopilin PulG